jgi:hypothetical protein
MSRRKRQVRIPAILEAVIETLEQQDFHNAKGAAGALRAFAEMAALEVPARGAFAADRPELYQRIERIATAHLGFGEVHRRFSEATESIPDAELRELIQVSANEMQTLSDQAYFYAGLAFGITLSRFGWPW